MVDGGRLIFEPTEVTYRQIMYYLDENMLKNVQAAPATPVANPPANSASTAAVKPADPKSQPGSAPKNTANNKAALPTLPSATANANKVTGTGPEARSLAANQTSGSVEVGLEPPPAPAPRPILKPISGGVLNGTALALPAPVYPEAAKRMRTSGVVTVDVVLDESGKVVSATASSGPVMLRESAIQAALKARFSPTKLSGQPVKVSGTINYKFALVP
jgi:protein TonB